MAHPDSATSALPASRLTAMRARDPHEPHRVASSLELFFDLVFVVAVGVASSELHHQLSAGELLNGVLMYGLTFFAIWWAWMNFGLSEASRTSEESHSFENRVGSHHVRIEVQSGVQEPGRS